MSRDSEIRRPKTAVVDGVTVTIGDKVALPPAPKLKVHPAHWVDDPAANAKGVFRNGRGKAK